MKNTMIETRKMCPKCGRRLYRLGGQKKGKPSQNNCHHCGYKENR